MYNEQQRLGPFLSIYLARTIIFTQILYLTLKTNINTQKAHKYSSAFSLMTLRTRTCFNSHYNHLELTSNLGCGVT